jgi:hypothetical protein
MIIVIKPELFHRIPDLKTHNSLVLLISFKYKYYKA